MRYLLLFLTTGIFGNFYIVFFLSILLYFYCVIKCKKIIIPKSKTFICLLAFELVYNIISLIYKTHEMTIATFPILFYLDGYLINNTFNKSRNRNYIYKNIIFIGIGFFIHAMLNYFTNINSIDRNIIDFWTKQPFTATLQAMMVVIYNSFLFYYLFYEKKIINKIIYIIGFLLSIMYLLLIASRTGILIIIIVFIISLLSYYSKNKKSIIKISIVLIIIATIILLLYKNNVFDINTIIKNSNLYSRINDTSTLNSDKSRVYYQINTFKEIIKSSIYKPDITEYKYAHNMWLDIGKETGIIPFTFLILFSLLSLKSTKRYLKLIKENNYHNLIIQVIICLNINFFVEPIQSIFLGIYCLIIGMIESNYYLIINNDNDTNIGSDSK